ncbi:hypothetical protein BB560_003281 [Smittium megazygosporum]|uniref:Uncharacterized protein n=1 Tax=Smittium megazygosporum TaxID=133381 RepID=A0A2T9ZCF8_9FUNG|nr:hypothetical protein BB560_003281 [Smittium megazygosporum]
MSVFSFENSDTRIWFYVFLSALATSLGAAILYVDDVLHFFGVPKTFSLIKSKSFLAASFSCAAAIMLYTAVFALHDESLSHFQDVKNYPFISDYSRVLTISLILLGAWGNNVLSIIFALLIFRNSGSDVEFCSHGSHDHVHYHEHPDANNSPNSSQNNHKDIYDSKSHLLHENHTNNLKNGKANNNSKSNVKNMGLFSSSYPDSSSPLLAQSSNHSKHSDKERKILKSNKEDRLVESSTNQSNLGIFSKQAHPGHKDYDTIEVDPACSKPNYIPTSSNCECNSDSLHIHKNNNNETYFFVHENEDNKYSKIELGDPSPQMPLTIDRNNSENMCYPSAKHCDDETCAGILNSEKVEDDVSSECSNSPTCDKSTTFLSDLLFQNANHINISNIYSNNEDLGADFLGSDNKDFNNNREFYQGFEPFVGKPHSSLPTTQNTDSKGSAHLRGNQNSCLYLDYEGLELPKDDNGTFINGLGEEREQNSKSQGLMMKKQGSKSLNIFSSQPFETNIDHVHFRGHVYEHVSHQSAAAASKKRQMSMFINGIKTAAAIAIHKFPEGIIMYISWKSSSKLGLWVSVSLFFHNFPEGMMLALPLYLGTNSRLKTFIAASILGIAPPVLGAFIGSLLFNYEAGLPPSDNLLSSGIENALRSYLIFNDQPKIIFNDTMNMAFGVIFGLTAGMMLAVSLNGMLPSARLYDPSGKIVISSFIISILLTATTGILFPG